MNLGIVANERAWKILQFGHIICPENRIFSLTNNVLKNDRKWNK